MKFMCTWLILYIFASYLGGLKISRQVDYAEKSYFSVGSQSFLDMNCRASQGSKALGLQRLHAMEVPIITQEAQCTPWMTFFLICQEDTCHLLFYIYKASFPSKTMETN